MTECTRVNCWSVLLFIMPTLRNELNWIILHHLFYRFLSPAAEKACQYLTNLLKTNPLLLRELNLSERKIGNSNVKQIAALLQDKHYTLNTLMWVFHIVLHFTCIISFNFKSVWCLTGLDEDCHCYPLNFVFLYRLNNNSITAEGCAALTSAINSNPSNLKELDLSGNKLGDSGIKNICPLLKNIQCRLKKFRCVF